MIKIMLYVALAILGTELFLIIYYWELVVAKVSSHWWLSLVALFGRLGVWGLLRVFGVFLIHALVEFLKVLLLDKLHNFLIQKQWFRNFKAGRKRSQRKISRNLKARWKRYNKIEKWIIIIAFAQATIALAGFILYFPIGRRHGFKTAQKKIGGGFLKRYFSYQILLTALEWFLALPLLKKYRKRKLKK